MTTMSVQTLSAIAQQLPSVVTTSSLCIAANAFGEILCPINDKISIIEASPFLSAPTLWSPKIGVLREIHPHRGLVLDFPSEEAISSDGDDDEE
uniref:Uncharacterized protein n=1 Tax=Romanomermis culicivorax TaxID=13658 RepID=A0A915IA82_ROMCU